MRIRKNAKLSPLLFSQESNQFEGEDSFSTGNVSLGDSIGAVESVASMMDTEEKEMPKIEDMVVEDKEHKMLDDNGEIEEQNGREKNLFCEKIDENGLQCKNKAKDGQSFCEHHLGTFLVSSNNNINSYHHHSSPPSCSTSKKAAAAAAAAAAGARRARARSGRKGSSSSNPYEFYYYSGFGPLWGKRRGDKSGVSDKFVENEMVATSANVVTTTTGSTSNPCSSSSTSSQMDNEDQFDYLDDDDDDEDNEDGAGKKRMRKPVKARSLKSLM
ncbi:WRC domain containing protein [Quillaja saponaria]|uniref:WRC domain containing protein n=1 Tax=Quillaja saponaria TaxID=32244 RepID=A0AAD7L4H4_QUISA|nr:WRC domain containing protein [Quillaja saponaria]